MPEISRFLGIVIQMYYSDHARGHTFTLDTAATILKWTLNQAWSQGNFRRAH